MRSCNFCSRSSICSSCHHTVIARSDYGARGVCVRTSGPTFTRGKGRRSVLRAGTLQHRASFFSSGLRDPQHHPPLHIHTNTSTIVHASTTLAGSGTPTIDIITCRLLCGSACTCLRSVVTGHIRLTGHHVGRASDVLEVLDAREVPSCATVLRARNKPTQCCLVCSRRTQTNRKKVPWKILTKFFKNQSLSCEFFPQGFLQNF